MSTPSVLIATAKVRPGMEKEFSAWKAHHDQVIGKFPGFVGSDILPPTDGSNEWTIMLNFKSAEELEAWRTSSERAAIIAEAVPLFEGGTLGEVAQPSSEGEKPDSNVTEVVFSKVKAGMEDTYREWAARIQAAQASYPGYRGMFLQPAEEKGGYWTSIIRYDTAAHLEAWMKSAERRELLKETSGFIEHEQLTRLATSFPGWVPVDPMTGKGPPDWKTAMLVLLGLFPIVMLEMKFLSPILHNLGLHASLATFIGNSISVAGTSFLTMPYFVRCFGWWLFIKDESSNTTLKGVLLLMALFAAEVVLLWKLLPW